MKIKGISFYEQHIEKLIAAAFGLVLVGVVVMQFVTSPNAVTLEGKDVAPSQIQPRLEQKADSVLARLSGSAGARILESSTLPEAFDEFKKSVDGGVAPREQLPPVQPALLAALVPGDVSTGERPYHSPAFNAPHMVDVYQWDGTLDEAAVSQHADLAARFSSSPYDVNWVTPVAQTDVKSMRSELRRANPNAAPPVLQIPVHWYNDSIYIVDMTFERQEKQSDGTWGDPTVVSVLPGAYTYRPLVPKADFALRQSVFTELSDPRRAMEILQPDFLPCKGDGFSASLVLGADEPAAPAGNEEANAIRSLKRQASRVANDIATTEEELKPLGGPLADEGADDRRDRRDREDRSRGGGREGGGGAAPPGGGSGFGSGTGPGKNTPGADDEATKQKRRQLTKRLNALKAKLDRINAELAKVAPNEQVTLGTARTIDLSKDESVVAWSHDIDVQPGKTYRYRCRAELFNPFFAKKQQLVKGQAELAERFLMGSAWSEWGSEITIEPPVTFFIADASPSEGRLGLGVARIELYRYVDGKRRTETIQVQPGDRIGGVSDRTRDGTAPVDFSTDWYVVDVVPASSASGERSSRQGGKVIVRRTDESRTEVRSPASDLNNPVRSRFLDDVMAAKLATDESQGTPK